MESVSPPQISNTHVCVRVCFLRKNLNTKSVETQLQEPTFNLINQQGIQDLVETFSQTPSERGSTKKVRKATRLNVNDLKHWIFKTGGKKKKGKRLTGENFFTTLMDNFAGLSKLVCISAQNSRDPVEI